MEVEDVVVVPVDWDGLVDVLLLLLVFPDDEEFGFVVIVLAFEEDMELADDEDVTCELPPEESDGPGDGGPAVEALYADWTLKAAKRFAKNGRLVDMVAAVPSITMGFVSLPSLFFL